MEKKKCDHGTSPHTRTYTMGRNMLKAVCVCVIAVSVIEAETETETHNVFGNWMLQFVFSRYADAVLSAQNNKAIPHSS